MASSRKLACRKSPPNSFFVNPTVDGSYANEPNFNLLSLTPVSPSKGTELKNVRLLRSNALCYGSVNRSGESLIGSSDKTPRDPKGKYVKSCEKLNPLSNVGFVKSGQKNDPKGKSVVEVEEIKCESADNRKRKMDETRGHTNNNDLKNWKFCFKQEDISKPSIGVPKVDVVKTLRDKLNERQQHLFSETCFGFFLDLPPVTIQPQLIHSLLMREVVQPNNDELWFSVNDVIIRFGIREFAIITGLKCNGIAHNRYDGIKRNRLVDRCFAGTEKLNVQAIVDCFESQRWTNDQDAVKIAVLYFIHTFLLSSLPENKVSNGHFELVESGEYETYPWGKISYDETLLSLKNALRGKPGKKYFRLYGFPLAFQTWFYESCPIAKEEFAILVEEKVPRILRWNVLRNPKSNQVLKILTHPKLKLRNISPTKVEKAVLYLGDFFEDEAEVAAVADIAVKSCDSDFTSPPPVPTRKRTEDFYIDVPESQIVPYTNPGANRITPNVTSRHGRTAHIHVGNTHNRLNGVTGPREGIGRVGDDPMCGKDKSEEVNKIAREYSVEDFYIDVPESQIVPYTNPGANGITPDVTSNDNRPAHILGLNGVTGPQEGIGRVDQYGDGSMCGLDKREEVNEVATKEYSVEDFCIDVPESQIVPYTNPGLNEITPDVKTRDRRPAQVLVSPYLTEFGSGFLDKKWFKGNHPFERFIPDEILHNILTDFFKWLKEGPITHRSRKMTKENAIKTPYRLGVMLVEKKEWFHALAYAGQPMSNTHIDVIFYYLRKKGKYEIDLPEKFTTTDCFFDSEIKQLYQDYLANNDRSLIKPVHVCAEYILGNEILCNTPWHTVNHILFPIHVDGKSHWILARLSIHERCIYIYDSKRGAAHNAKVRKAVFPYSVVIPYFLCVTGFYGKRNDIDWCMGPYKNKNVVEDFDINLVDGLPVQKKSDCGVYVAAFAEYFIEGSGKPDDDFEVDDHRSRFGALLWYYGKMKQDQDIVSDTELNVD